MALKPVTAKTILDTLKKNGRQDLANFQQGFFKTHRAGYGEGDLFFGWSVPPIRALSKQYKNLELPEIIVLLESPYHEARLLALFIMVLQYAKSSSKHQNALFRTYIRYKAYVNNWDLVDASAPYISGPHLFNKDRALLFRLAKSKHLWDRRIAIISTLYFIRKNDFSDTVKISKLLLADKHDLIHKASGWMLREAGKRNLAVLLSFLDLHHRKMPRTMLRYAIEKLSTKQKKHYMRRD